MKKIILLICFALVGCSEKTVVLVSADGSKKLVYKCNDFHPQVQTTEDIVILIKSMQEVLTQAQSLGETLTCQEIMKTVQAQDYRKMEKIVFDYKCTHK